jgi:hypothetical protein
MHNCSTDYPQKYQFDYATTSKLSISLTHSQTTNLSVFRANKISEGFGFFVVVAPISVFLVAMVMWVICWTNILHLQNIATFWAALDRAVAGHLLHVRKCNTRHMLKVGTLP